MALQLLLTLILACVAPGEAYTPGGHGQDVLYDKERFKLACPDYKTYSTYGQ
jgi:hypothetical protein